METVYIKPIASFKDYKKHFGSYYNSLPKNLYNPINDICVCDETDNSVLFILKKKAIPIQHIENTVKHYIPIIQRFKSTNRGFASGTKEREIHAHFERSKEVHSTVAGYIDSPNNKRPCRLSQFSKVHFENYKEGIPMIKDVDALFKKTLPERYNAQFEKASRTTFRIEDTAFTTITINYNFQTALHVDKGDCKEGFGVLVVSSKGTGGFLLFPRFDIGIVVHTGDVLFMNVHEYHCNSPIDEGDERMSFVFYLRNRLLECHHNEMLEDLGIVDSKNWDTTVLVEHIMKKIGCEAIDFDDYVDTEHYTFKCKNRAYILVVKATGVTIKNLYNIWKFFHLKEFVI